MRKDVVYLLVKGEKIQAFGNLKTLVDSIGLPEKYSTIWRKLTTGKGRCEFGDYQIKRVSIRRAPYSFRAA